MRYLKSFKQLNESALNESMTEIDKQKIKDAITNNAFLSLRNPLTQLGYKVDFSFEPQAHYTVKKGKDTIVIINKKYVTDPEFVHGEIAMGLLGENHVEEHHFVPKESVMEYEDKIFTKASFGIAINVQPLKEYLEKFFSVTFTDSSDLHLHQPEAGRYSLEIELSSKAEMIDSLTWRKLAEEFSEFEYVEDTSENTNKNRFTLDLREGNEYDLITTLQRKNDITQLERGKLQENSSDKTVSGLTYEPIKKVIMHVADFLGFQEADVLKARVKILSDNLFDVSGIGPGNKFINIEISDDGSEIKIIPDNSAEKTIPNPFKDLDEDLDYDKLKSVYDIKTRNPLAASILRRAVMGNFISIEDSKITSIKGVAEEVADEHADDEEIGSSDFTFILKEFLDGLGLKTDFPKGRLEIVGGEIDKRYYQNQDSGMNHSTGFNGGRGH